MRVKQIIIDEIVCKYFFYFLVIEINLTRIIDHDYFKWFTVSYQFVYK